MSVGRCRKWVVREVIKSANVLSGQPVVASSGLPSLRQSMLDNKRVEALALVPSHIGFAPGAAKPRTV